MKFPILLTKLSALTLVAAKMIYCFYLVSIMITGYGSTTAGEAYTLECSADGVSATFQWFEKKMELKSTPVARDLLLHLLSTVNYDLLHCMFPIEKTGHAKLL